MDEQAIRDTVSRQREYFLSGKTKPAAARAEALKTIERMTQENENEIYDAVKSDLGRSHSESYMGEMLCLRGELSHALKNFRKWMKGKTVRTPLVHMPAVSRIEPEPYGTALIMSPWNYPVQLALIPAISALAAGNTAVIKPSEYSPSVSALLKRLADKYFKPEILTVIEGGMEEAKLLLKERFDYIFYTGGPQGGKAVLRAAAEHITPATVELGGKSPCVAYGIKNIKSAAKRIAWGKFFNAGQTCVAPDYLLVHKEIKEALVSEIKEQIESMYGKNPHESRDYARIINDRHFARLKSLIECGHAVCGGLTAQEERYIAPTLLEKVAPESPVMQEEIFGPILPVIEFSEPEEAVKIIQGKEKPLALYIFSENREFVSSMLSLISSGGACVNDTLVHITTSSLPFGGVGGSGYGSYHGKAGFDTFSHNRSIMRRALGMDVPMKFPPYGDFSQNMKKFFEITNA